MTEGDFFLGSDKDLLKRVTPVFSTANDEVATGEVRIDTGSSNSDNVAVVRLVNNLPTVNKNVQVFNGTYFSTL